MNEIGLRGRRPGKTGTYLPVERILRVKKLLAFGWSYNQIMTEMAIGNSTVAKIKQGKYDEYLEGEQNENINSV